MKPFRVHLGEEVEPHFETYETKGGASFFSDCDGLGGSVDEPPPPTFGGGAGGGWLHLPAARETGGSVLPQLRAQPAHPFAPGGWEQISE